MINLPLVSIILGTRPEAIKLAPVIIEFKKCNLIRTRVILTGQHRELVKQVMDLFEIHHDTDLNLMKESQSLTHITCSSLEGLEKEFREFSPQLVLVQGDTSTAFSAALAAFFQKIPIGHIEAGLRTNNLNNPFPEEINRRLISQLSSINYAPTKESSENLKSSGIQGKIEITGNTVIDSLLLIAKKKKVPFTKKIDWENQEVIFATIHRRENWGDPIKDIAQGILKVINKNKNTSLLLPMHPNSKVREIIIPILGNHPRIELTEPLAYDELVACITRSKIILTDSGGLQEEAPSLGKPVLVLRQTTERVEAIQAGTAKLIGTNSENIFFETENLLNDNEAYDSMSQAKNPYGDGKSSKRILKSCLRFLDL